MALSFPRFMAGVLPAEDSPVDTKVDTHLYLDAEMRSRIDVQAFAEGGVPGPLQPIFHRRMDGLELKTRREPPIVPIPERIAVAEPDGPDAKYLALAEKLHIKSAAILESKLESILHSEFIQIFEYEKVVAYLDNLVEKRNYELRHELWKRAMWAWCPVRKSDRGVCNPKVEKSIYEGPLPFPALLTIEKIEAQLPEARFVVSQIKEVADPFLAVSVLGSNKLWVIERWDESGFRG